MNSPSRIASERRIACARCGASFVCGSGGRDGGCWCGDEPARLPMPALAAKDCLCPSCLRAALRQQAGDAACAPSR
jgi:hypothetical protein